MEEYDEKYGLQWDWQSIDGCMTKAPLGGSELVGKNPTDRGKNGVKRSMLSVGNGLPVSAAVSGANVHDTQLLEITLDSIVIERPDYNKYVQNLCLDAGYTGYYDKCAERGYIVHIRPRGEEKKEIENNPDFKARRWVVEVLHSWINRFRKLLVRFEKKANNYLGLLSFACSVIVWRRLLRAYPTIVRTYLACIFSAILPMIFLTSISLPANIPCKLTKNLTEQSAHILIIG